MVRLKKDIKERGIKVSSKVIFKCLTEIVYKCGTATYKKGQTCVAASSSADSDECTARTEAQTEEYCLCGKEDICTKVQICYSDNKKC